MRFTSALAKVPGFHTTAIFLRQYEATRGVEIVAVPHRPWVSDQHVLVDRSGEVWLPDPSGLYRTTAATAPTPLVDLAATYGPLVRFEPVTTLEVPS